jgi:hypothetical protein
MNEDSRRALAGRLKELEAEMDKLRVLHMEYERALRWHQLTMLRRLMQSWKRLLPDTPPQRSNPP